MVENPLYMNYSPVMDKNYIENILEYMDDTLQVKFHFVRSVLLEGKRDEAWRQYSYHAVSILKSGGRIKTWFENDGGRIFTRNVGNVCFLPAYRRRKVEIMPEKGSRGVEILSAALTFGILGNLDLLSFWDIPFLFNRKTEIALTEAIEALMLIEQDISMHPLERTVKRKNLCFQILCLLIGVSVLKQDAKERLRGYHLVEPALRRLNKDFNNNLKISDLAKSCYLSRSQFHHNFKCITGMSPLEYQQWRRLDEAKKLLLQSEKNIEEISADVGWNDQFHFSRIFKKSTGYAPSIFRKNYREGMDLYF